MSVQKLENKPCTLFTCSQVPEHFREPFISGGYRHPQSTFSECVESLFSNNNETLNCWTHYASALLFLTHLLVATLDDVSTHDVHVDDVTLSLLSPVRLLMFGACLYSLASAGAHTFNTMSLPARHICFFVDYAGLSVYSFAVACSSAAYSLPATWKRPGSHILYGRLYLPVAFFMACFCIVVSCSSRFLRPGLTRKIFRLSAFALPYLYITIPIFWRTLFFDETLRTVEALHFHQGQFMWAVTAVLFYVSHLPERKFPGKFDIFGHSHQWFHLCSFFATHWQIKAARLDRVEQESYNPHFPKVWQYIGGFVLLISIITGVVLVFASLAYKYLGEDTERTQELVPTLATPHDVPINSGNTNVSTTSGDTNHNWQTARRRIR